MAKVLYFNNSENHINMYIPIKVGSKIRHQGTGNRDPAPPEHTCMSVVEKDEAKTYQTMIIELQHYTKYHADLCTNKVILPDVPTMRRQTPGPISENAPKG